MSGLKEEFIELLTENSRIDGFDEISSRLIAILYAEPDSVSLEDLSKRTGYSLSAVSTAMKFLADSLVSSAVKKIKKPKSKKLFFYMEKDASAVFIEMIKKRCEKLIAPSKQRISEIVEKHKNEKSKTSKNDMNIINDYCSQISASERLLQELIKKIKELDKKNRGNL